MQRIMLVVSVLAVAFWMAASDHAAQDPGHVTNNQPIEVRRAGSDRGGAPRNPLPVINGKTTSDGKVTMTLRNNTNRTATDVHLKLILPRDGSPNKYRITAFESFGNPGFPVEDIAADGQTGGAKAAAGGQPIPSGGETVIGVTIKDDQGNPYEGPVRFKPYFTSADIAISATSPDQIGDARPRTSLASVVPNYNPATVLMAATTPSVECNDICLAEVDGYRFQPGSLVFSPTNGGYFEIDEDNTIIRAYTASGVDVTGSEGISTSNMRIDDMGNFVFDVSRNQDATQHVVLVIRGLVVTGLEVHEPGQEIGAGVSGSAISGYVLDDLYDLVLVTE